MSGSLFGTTAPRCADVVLVLEIGMGLALLGGALQASRKRFRSHACCQSAVVLLNFVIILLVMVPSFQVHVSPKIPAKLGKAYYSLATTHAALGGVTEIAALYILLAAGNNILPLQFRWTSYKIWMRSVLALWWLVLSLAVNGDILSTNGNDGNLVVTKPNGAQSTTILLDPAGAGVLFGLTAVPGQGVYFGDDGRNTLDLLH